MKDNKTLVKALSENLGNVPTKDLVLKEYERILNIQWFKPMTEPPEETEQKVKLACKLFGVEASVEYHKLATPSDWVFARDAAREAAWDATFEVVTDIDSIKKKYPENPFKVLIDLWEMGFYVAGVVKGKFILYYVPKL